MEPLIPADRLAALASPDQDFMVSGTGRKLLSGIFLLAHRLHRGIILLAGAQANRPVP